MLVLILFLAAPPIPSVIPLVHAHAHNDYVHRRPLFDALANGFCSVEADVFLVRGELLVGHTWLDLRKGRTLEALYLEPLRRRARDGKGQIYSANAPFFLMIDVKTDGKSTYEVIDRVLAKYSDIVTSVRNGKVERRGVTVVISGDCPREVLRKQETRWAAIDGRPTDLDSDAPGHLIPWISDSWSSHFRWRGQGEMPKPERDKMREMVRKAHAHGRLVRFWGAPDRKEVWGEQRTAGVDLINTDRLDELRRFLLAEKP